MFYHITTTCDKEKLKKILKDIDPLAKVIEPRVGRPRLEGVEEFILERLPCRVRKLQKEASKKGFPWVTIVRYKKEMGIISQKRGDSWWWVSAM